jgi:hypothetical protein
MSAWHPRGVVTSKVSTSESLGPFLLMKYRGATMATPPTYRDKWQSTTGATVDHVEASFGDQFPSNEFLLSAEAENESGDN